MLGVLSHLHIQHVLRGVPPPADMLKHDAAYKAFLAATLRLARSVTCLVSLHDTPPAAGADALPFVGPTAS